MQPSRFTMLLLGVITALATASRAGAAQEAPAPAGSAATYVGSDVCASCHDQAAEHLAKTPHGSNHQKLQKTSVPYLCQQCHSNTRHPGTLYDGSTLADQARASNRIFNRACVGCHSAIHGSNHPSSPYLAH